MALIAWASSVGTTKFRWEEAEREFKRAIETNPNDSNAHYFYAHSCLVPQKRFDENLLTSPTELIPHFDYQSAFVLSDSKFRPRIFKNISSLAVRPD
jgi:hypothetical protein